MNVAEAVGAALVAVGVDHVFGVVGSGNFHVTRAMVASGARFVAARHEAGAATMADAYARMSGTVSAVSVHQGCGLTNALTGITEAAKSRTPMVVLAAEVNEPRSNFFVDQPALAAAVGAVSMRITSGESAVPQACAAVATALHDRRTVLLNLPLHVQSDTAVDLTPRLPEREVAGDIDPGSVSVLLAQLERAQRPVFVAGRGSRGPGCRDALEALAERYGALLATSAVARGLFNGNPWSLDVSGGFASPVAAHLISDADLVIGWGCALNMWTTRHGSLISERATVVRVDDDESAVPPDADRRLAVIGDVRTAASAALALAPAPRPGYRSDNVREEIGQQLRWRDVAYVDDSTVHRIDPRTLSIALDDILPTERVMGIMYLMITSVMI